jgi:hypothetical protein
MKKSIVITLCCLMFLLFSGISAVEACKQGCQALEASPIVRERTQGDNGYTQEDARNTPQCSKGCQSDNCEVVSDIGYTSQGTPRQIEVLIPITELVNDIQKIKQTIITPVCEETTVIQQPYSYLMSGTEETLQSDECVDDGSGNCVPAIPGSPRSPIQVNGTTVWGDAETQVSKKCYNEVNVTILPQVIQKNATTYKIVRFTWMDYVDTEVIKTISKGTPHVSEILLPSDCAYCESEKNREIYPSYQTHEHLGDHIVRIIFKPKEISEDRQPEPRCGSSGEY